MTVGDGLIMVKKLRINLKLKVMTLLKFGFPLWDPVYGPDIDDDLDEEEDEDFDGL